MAKTIVFLNLADMDENGLAKKSVKALRQKYPPSNYIYEFIAGANRVYQIDLFGLLKNDPSLKSGMPKVPMNLFSNLFSDYTQGLLPYGVSERIAISMLCGKADKIMLGIHGKYDDTEKGLAGLGWDNGSAALGTYKEFAKLISSFLTSDKTYKLALIVCFGARSENYRRDHNGNLDENDIKSSFAYKFYKEICQKGKKITMTARTGSVSFDENSGRSLVQSEAAVLAEVENDELQSAQKTKDIQAAYNQLQEKMRYSAEGNAEFFKISLEMEKPNSIPTTQAEKTIKNFMNIQNKVGDLQSTSSEMISKYGKFVYTYDGKEVTVFRKYENGKKIMQEIYRGNL